jgi:hypothetical protein
MGTVYKTGHLGQYSIQTTGWMIRIRLPAEAGNFSLCHCVQIGSGAHPASYPMDTRGFPTGVKRPEREADDSTPSIAQVKNAWSYTSTLP